MKKSQLSKFRFGSADYVIAHALISEKKGKKGKMPSMSFCGVRDPQKALFYAMLTKKFDTELKTNGDGTRTMFNTNRFDGKYVAMLSSKNSFVVASGDSPKKVFKKAVKRGVKNPAIAYVKSANEWEIVIDFT